MKFIINVLLFGLATAVWVVVAAMFGMPGARDGELHLAGDYYFTHSGGVQNSITEEREVGSRFVIPMKVEEFVVLGGGIFATRRPVSSDFRLTDTCEYYRIDVAARKVSGPFALAEVKNRAEWAVLKGQKLDLDFGATMCKLAAAAS